MTFTESKKPNKKLRTLNPKTQLRVIVTGSTQDKENGELFIVSKTRVKTGMEKEEEKEHHLQEALESQSMSMKGDSQASTSIPIPSVEVIDPEWSRFQSKRFLSPATPGTDEEELANQVMDEDCYDLDEEDAEWLQAYALKSAEITWDEFENAMETLENNSRKKIISFSQFALKCSEINRNKLSAIYDYWVDKRETLCKGLYPSASLIPTVPDNSDAEDSNPYVVFRKREVGTRRRSARISFHSLLGHNTNRKIIKTEEEKENARLEHLDELQYQVDRNSELDGNFAFKRNKYCTYKTSGHFAYDEAD